MPRICAQPESDLSRVSFLKPYERLEPCEGKLSRTVLRGGTGSNAGLLPDQTIENKQKFIGQIMTSKSPVRACDDIDEATLSYAEVKALCAGDDRIKQKMDLDIEVSKLKLLKSNHQSQQFRMQDDIMTHFPEKIESYERLIAGLKVDGKTVNEHPHPTDGFSGIEIGGTILSEKEAAGAAILEACKNVTGLEPVKIGNYRGFSMSLTLENFSSQYVLTMKAPRCCGIRSSSCGGRNKEPL